MTRGLPILRAGVLVATLGSIAPGQVVQQVYPVPEELERTLARMRAELDALKADRDASAAREKESEARYQALLEAIDALSKTGDPWKTAAREAASANAWYERLTLGGYGEIHVNAVEGKGHDQIDNQRFVAFLGHRFADWIELHSETEIAHSLVAPDGGGELDLEQLYFDFRIDDAISVRAGRFLTPVGIINRVHEPTTFNGVERPAVETFVLPSTWSSDGVGVFGDLRENVKYELYVSDGLDAAGFSALEGIRGGRQEETPGVSNPALSGRLDYYPIVAGGQSLRLGASCFAGGADNGNGGVDPGIGSHVGVYSTDFQYSLAKWDIRGVYARIDIGDAAEIGNNVASRIDGYYLEAAYHFWPERWKEGRLANSDAIAFVRYDDYDTQKKVPSGETRDLHGDRSELTFGFSFFPTTDVVLKADYQIKDDASGDGVPDQFNLGLGFSF